MEKESRKGRGLLKELVIPFAILFILQALVLAVAMRLSAISVLQDNAQEVSSKLVLSRKNEIQNKVLFNWTKCDTAIKQLNDIYAEMSLDDKNIWSQSVQADFFVESHPILVSILRQNIVNGAFIVLNDSPSFSNFTEGATRWGLGIRDYDCESSYVHNEDIVTVRSPASIQSQISSADAYWENKYTFRSKEASNFFYKPLEVAFIKPELSVSSLGYFSNQYRLEEDDGMKVMAYSVPLIYDGQPYGVFGVEISINYLEKHLLHSELGDNQCTTYVMAKVNATDGNYDVLASKGSYFTQLFGSASHLDIENKVGRTVYNIKVHANEQNAIGFVSPFKLYNSDSPFNKEQLLLIGLIEEDSLYSAMNKTTTIIYLILIICTLLGLACVYYISKKITKPIEELSGEVKDMNPEGEIKLNKVGVKEIDGLILAIEEMHKRMTENFAKTEFFARMSHDMRTPMNAIIGFSDDEIVKSATKKQNLDFFSKINDSGKYLLSLINDVLDMSKIETGKIQIFNAVENFDKVIKSTLNIIDELATKKGVNLKVNPLPNQKDLYIEVDKNRIQQVLLNILSNAVKFTFSGGNISFSINELMRNDKVIKVEYIIEDNGCGMSEKFLKTLYTAFQQENANGGSGLGLAIAKKTIDLLGGSIDCKSTLGEGTTFTVVLEHKIVTQKLAKKVVEGEEIPLEALNKKRVLLCEDNEINIHLAEFLLKKHGMLVESAKDGQEAVDIFSKSSEFYYDLILMDIRMPNMNGIEATKIIRKLERKDVKTLPIIALTANTFEEDVTETKKAGMNAHIAKPIAPKELYTTMAKLLAKKRH